MPEFIRKPLEGLLPLIPLSLHADELIDLDGIAHSIGLVAAGGAPGCIVFGSMGQMTNVSPDEFDAVCDTAVATGHEAGLAVVVGSTATYEAEAIRRARYAEACGADGSMLAAPYALPLTADWAVEFFSAVASSLDGDMALMLYNYSPLNGVNITPAMWERLLEAPNIKAIKESNMALPHFDEVLRRIGDRVNVFCGNDPAFLHGAAMGAVGATGYFCWAGMRTAVRFVAQCRAGNQNDPWVRRAFAGLQGLSACIRRADMPSMLSYEYGYLKAISELGGARPGLPRRPFGPLPAAAVEAVRAAAGPLMAMEAEL